MMTRILNNRSNLIPVALGALLLAASVPPALAQTSSTTAATSSSAPANASQPNGSLQKSHGDWRSTRLEGANVYNEHGTSIGTIDDMLLDSEGKVSNVVLSVGGFLGVGNKYVEVPFSKLRFEPSRGNTAANSNAANNTGTGGTNADYSVVLPGVTKDSLNAMTGFSF